MRSSGARATSCGKLAGASAVLADGVARAVLLRTSARAYRVGER